MFRVFRTEEFNKSFDKLEHSEQIRAEKILNQLLQQADYVGKPLAGLAFFREKKFDGKRLYFLVYNSIYAALAVAISDKKAQQATIDRILQDLPAYKQYISNLLK